MPRKTRRSKAAEQREQIKKEYVDLNMPQATSCSSDELSLRNEVVTDCKVISGTIHQGDTCFQYPGIQCTYISFFALISMKIKDPSVWIENDIDFCINSGNDGFIKHCFEQNWQPKMLLVNELPQVINVNSTVYECHQLDSYIAIGTLAPPILDESSCISSTINDAIVQCFDISDFCLLVCGGQTIALAKRNNNFFIFDPHSRDKVGLLHHSGNAVLVSFVEIQSLIVFVRKLLMDSLELKPSEQFELVPILISELHGSKGERAEGGFSMNSENHSIPESPLPKIYANENPDIGISEHAMIGNLDADRKQFSLSMHSRAMSSFEDQNKCDKEHKENISKQNIDIPKTNTRKDYMRRYMRKRRENESFRERDNVKAAERMTKILNTEEGRKKHNKRAAETMQKILSTEEARRKHNKGAAETMQKIRNTEEGRRKHNERSAERMQDILSTEEGRQKHNKRSAEGMQKLLSTEEGRLKHNKRSAVGMQKILSTDEGRQKHNKRSTERMKQILSTEEGRRMHNESSAKVSQRIRSTDEGKRTHNKRSAEVMQKIRKTIEGKRKNKEVAYTGMKQLRKNSEYLKVEHLRRRRQRFGDSFSESVNKFKEAINASSLYVCSCCHQTWFQHSIKKVSSLNESSFNTDLLNKCLTGYISVGNCEWICNTCLYNIKQGKIPKLSVINGMKFPYKPPELNISNLEERLISLRIPFMQIRALNSGGQFSLKGPVVNVPTEIEPTIHALPRLQKKTETIPVKLKKMKEFKHAVVTENVRPHAVLAALKTLLDTSQLYKEADITVDDKWNMDDTKPVTEDSTSKYQPNSDNESDTFSEIDDDNETPVMTLLDEQSLDKNEVLSVAPGEGQKPLSIFKDPNAEYLAFPTLFCGQKRMENSDRYVPVYYSDICKWELRCVDRRVALHIPNMFYKMKKLQIEQVCSKIHLAVRRCKTKGKSYSAGYILKDNMGESLVRLDEGYRIFKTIRNSPQYWENQKREVFAMIRQLGLPTLFLSLSANDLHWSELIIALGKLVDNKDYTEAVECNTLSWETRSRLVQSDPATCVRHFDHRVSQFIETILKSPQSPFGVLQDFFYRVEFQQRGSPHIHMLAWIEGSPKYSENEDEEVVEYVDRVASCCADVSDELKEILDFQKHKHSRTCRKAGKPVCRFGIPFPPMRKTTIIKPYVEDDRDIYEEHYKTVQEILNNLEQDISFDEFLEKVRITEADYMKAVQTSVKTEKIFLKRRPIECRINPYMKDLLGVWKANHDIQFVLDAYACAMYIVSYINKSAKGMSRLMEDACKEARKGSKSLKESVKHIGNKFLNAVEVSAQEAAYLILQLSMSAKSRKCEFVPTAPPSERTFLLKSKKELEAMPQDSTEIEADNVIKRYMRRQEVLEDYCLADFISRIVSISKIQAILPKTSERTETHDYANDDNFEDEYEENKIPQMDTENTSKLRYSVTKGNYRIVLRTKPKVLRYVNYNKKVDSENFYREQLMLFTPWRNEENDLLNGYNTYQDHFNLLEGTILSKRKEYDSHSELIDEVEAAAETQTIDIFDDVCPNIENIEARDAQEEPVSSTKFAFYNPENRSHAFYDLGPDIGVVSHIENDIEIVQNRMPENDYLQLISKLNKKQRKIFTHIVHSITHSPEEQLCVFITGGAGVGKSVVIRTLYQALHRLRGSNFGQDPEDIRILLCAYTGLAAYNIQGFTLHNALCIEPNKKLKYKPLTDDKRNTLKTKYRYLSVLIVDEVSMVGNSMLNYLFLRLQEIKGNREPFGGVHVILVGDLYQLRPVADGWIFANNSEGYTSLAPNLWQAYFTFFELTEIMRQKDDAPFAELLNRIREGKQTEGDMKTLQSRSVSSESVEYVSLRNELHLFPCNSSVDAHNKDVYDRSTSQKAEINCSDTILGEDSKEVKEKILRQLKGKKTSDTGNLSEILKVGVDLCYDTTHNISVSDGICNGTPCKLKKIHYLEKHNPIPSCLWVEFPDVNIGKETRKDNTYYYRKYPEISKDWTPIWAVKRTFMFRRKAVVRQQYPLKASTAKTIHKAQGQTKTRVIVDMSSGSRPHQHYVAFSRVTSLQGLFLLNGLSGHINVDKSVIREMERLRRDAGIKLSYTPVNSYNCDLLMVFQNAQSLHLHFPQIRNDETFIAADVICLAETRLHQNDQDADYSIEGFSPIIRCDQYARIPGIRPAHGLAMYVKNCHRIVSSETISREKCELLTVNVLNMCSNKLYTVVIIYKAPSCSLEDFKACVRPLTRFKLSERLVIMGDFNFDVSRDRNKNFIRFMQSVFEKAEMLNTISTTQDSTVLDLCFTTCNLAKANVVTCVWSYHHTLVTAIF